MKKEPSSIESIEPIVLKVGNLRIERESVILHEVNWEVRRNEHWVVLGANGSGKTSLLSAVTGYLTPSQGALQVGSAIYGKTDWSQVRPHIGLVSSSLGQKIEPEETAEEIVLTGPGAQINYWGELGKDERKWADRELRKVNAAHLSQRPWNQLSQGERQRILIARALSSQPSILFLDEPCAGLDPVAREDFLTFIQDLCEQGKSPHLVLITHHVEEIIPAMTHILLIRKGRVVEAGKKEEVLTSKLLSETFDAPLRLRKTIRAGKLRYQIDIEGGRSSSFKKAKK